MTPGQEPSGTTARDTTARALAETVRRLQGAAARVQADARARAVVDLATGILAERLGLLPAEAAARLARLAREAAVPVAALAADIAGVSGQAAGAADPAPPDPVTPALAAVVDLQGVAEAVLEQTADALGAHAVALWLRLPGGVLALAAHAGLPAAEADAWSRVPPGVPTPAQRVVVGGAELWPGDPQAAGPSVGAGSARAVLPLIGAGRRRGALEVLWPAPGPGPDSGPGPAPVLGEPQRRRLHALADLCATLLADADTGASARAFVPAAVPAPAPVPPGDDTALLEGLPTPALLLEPVVRRGEITDFTLLRTNAHFRDPLGRPRDTLEGASLLEVYPAACAGGLFERLLRVHETGAPLAGERVRLVFQQGGLALPATVLLAAAPVGGRVLVGWQTETARTGEADQTALLRQAQRLARVAGFEECPADGRIRWSDGLHEIYGLAPDTDPVPLAQLARHAHPDDEPAIRRLLDTVQRRHRTASAVVRLVHRDGTHRYTRVIAEPVLDDDGRLTGVRGALHDVSAQHRTEVALGATRARLADSEQETADSERLALRLQQAILPTAPPPLGPAGLRAAVRYRPAAQHDRVGGDWYDVLLLPDKRVLLTVGDVAGHGVGAATGMVALRHALRGLAVTGAGPARMLEWANTVALREPGQITATAVCVLVDPAGGELRWARAGHLPPILVGADGAQVLPLPHGVLLGALDDARYEERTAHLPPGDVLVLYTDGLVERRDRPVEESVDQLIRAAGAPGPDLERYLDRLLDLSPADTDDDTCLIAVQSR
ncbi:PP2C family protein-serine/threonine phosphatase [Kitasatospora sp. NPDC057940]|uniref:PP2C family protein-serine/threonine phosphatase n=1 Tax=Kitasatospora sp. NPDC057940 TaxID=3346285 RepID=UPI0036D9CB90